MQPRHKRAATSSSAGVGEEESRIDALQRENALLKQSLGYSIDAICALLNGRKLDVLLESRASEMVKHFLVFRGDAIGGGEWVSREAPDELGSLSSPLMYRAFFSELDKWLEEQVRLQHKEERDLRDKLRGWKKNWTVPI